MIYLGVFFSSIVLFYPLQTGEILQFEELYFSIGWLKPRPLELPGAINEISGISGMCGWSDIMIRLMVQKSRGSPVEVGSLSP